jgi:hypothetical protein
VTGPSTQSAEAAVKLQNMTDYSFILFITIWPLFALGYGGGIIYGLRFLRKNELVDTRVAEFTEDMMFGGLGYNYKLFYYFHSKAHGKAPTIFLLAVHVICAIMVFVFPAML